MDILAIAESEVTAQSAEGMTASMPLVQFTAGLRPAPTGLEDVLYPDGVKHVWTQFPMAILLYERPPQVVRVRWIAPDSVNTHGPHTRYRQHKISLPYVIVFAVFAVRDTSVGLRLTQRCEVFFRREPLSSLADEVLFPCLLNASKHKPPDRVLPYCAADPRAVAVPGKCLSWLCSQHLALKPFDRMPMNERVRASLAGLVEHLLYSGFNHSSDSGQWPGEEASWFTISLQKAIDPRVASPEAWEKATLRNPDFILEVPFLRSGFSAGEVAQRLFQEFNMAAPPLNTSQALARVVFNSGQPRRFVYPHKLWASESD
ncbi:MAG: hypothetical protein KKC51_14040 [Verrucomicrobia bacterium]|nr:hypothetical protein [Verrucomicrobiota bacterium]